MFQSKSILVILLLAISQLAAAGSSLNRRAPLSERAVKHRTNAARMAAGLGPLPPAEIQRRHGGGGGGPPGPGHNFPGNPQTPTQPSPPKPSQGKPGKPDCDDKHNVPIKCKRKGTGQHVGYVGRDWSKKGKRGFGLCKDKRDALNLDFENSVTPFDFKISKGGDFPFLGFAGNNLRPGSPDSAVLTGTRKTNRENSPSNVGNAFPGWAANSESQVWYYTRANKSVTSKWFNQGGISVESKIFYDPEDDLFHLVTDTNAFKRKCPQAFEVELEIEDDD